MNKLLLGFLIANLAATAFLWNSASDARDAQRDAVAKALEQAQETQKANLNAKVLGDRLDALDGSLDSLLTGVSKLTKDTSSRLRALETLIQEPGDTDESFACLRRPVPAGLDRLLREPTGDRAGQ